MVTQKAIIYCRVSSRKQIEEGSGLESQEKLCKDYAARMGYDVVRVFKEKGISGGLFERPEMKNLMSFLDKHLTEKYVIIFDDLKRFARDISIHIQLKKQLISKGVKLECPNFRFEDSPEGRLIEYVTAATSQYERESNQRQVIQKMKARLERGYWPFRSPPRGLRYVKEEAHGKILRNDQPYASIYKEAIEGYEKDVLLDQVDVQDFINKKLREIGLNETISFDRVARLLKELLYTGYVEYPKWDVPLKKGQHDGFISLETYRNVQDKLAGKRRKIVKTNYTYDFPLRGSALCSSCGRPLTASWCRGRSQRYPKYWCSNKDCIYYAKTMPKDVIETRFEALLHDVKVSEGKAKLIEAIFTRTWEEEKNDNQAVQVSLQRREAQLLSTIDGLTKRISVNKDSYLISVYENQLKKLALELDNLRKPIKKKEYTPEEFRTAYETVFNIIKEPVRMWRSPEYRDKATIIKMYFPNRVAYDYERGFRTEGIEPVINLINGIDLSKKCLVEMPGVEPGCKKVVFKDFVASLSRRKVGRF